MKISGIVVKGKGEGALLGFPTANIKTDQPCSLADGVYLAETVYRGKQYRSLAVFGFFKDFEVWLRDFSGDLYGQRLTIEIGQQISQVTTIVGQEDLIKKIKDDIKKAEKLWEIN